MKFIVSRASHKVPGIKGYGYTDATVQEWYPEGVITIKTLSELMQFIKKYGTVVIRDEGNVPDVDEGIGRTIIIYDDYME